MKKERKKGTIKKGYFLGIAVVVAALLFIGTVPQGAKASIILKDEQGNPITASKIILDGADLGSATGEITSEDLDVGEHTLIIFWNGAQYTKTFYFNGEETIILIRLSSPVETRISVWNKNLNQPIADVVVYVDGEVKGTTGTDGLVTVTLEPGSHTFRLLGSGVSHEGIRAVSSEASFVEFKVGRTSIVTVTVLDELTGFPVKGATVYIDAVCKGETSASGSLEISDVKDGSHEIEARYKGSSESKSVTVTQTTTSFSLSIPVPRTITLTVTDEETGLPADGIDIYVDDAKKGATTQNGELVIEDILPGRHKVGLDVSGYTGMVERYIDVGMQENIPLTIDMPNPRFYAEMSVWESYGWQVYGNVEVRLRNMGEVNSQDTAVLILVYIPQDNPDAPVATRLLEFGSLAPGATSPPERVEIPEFAMFKQEYVVAVVLDRCEYTPQNEEAIGEITVPPSIFEQWTLEAKQYLQEHPEIIGKIAGFLLKIY